MDRPLRDAVHGIVQHGFLHKALADNPRLVKSTPTPPAARLAPLAPITFPESLPVSARRDEIAQAIEANQVVIVCGETGSGKTTQLPKIVLELGRGRVRDARG